MPKTVDTRDRLVATARKLFWQQGYSATGVAQILKEAQARSGSLYHFFPTKEDLLKAVLEEYKLMLMPAVMEPVFQKVADPIERVFGVLDAYRRGLLYSEFNAGCPIGNLALELSDAHPEVRQLIAENFTGWMEQIRACLESAGERLPADLDRNSLASFILTVMEGAVMQCRAYRSQEPFDAAISQLRDHFRRLQWQAAS
jgi:AcrR family transcriptional regulator